jgi:Uma2 family endonuclease
VVVLKDNLHNLQDKRIVGPPDLVIEIRSPGTAGYDRHRKQDAYARARVKEFWIADRYSETIEVLLLHEGGYQSAGVVSDGQRLPSRALPDLPFTAEQFFAGTGA